MPKTKNKNKQLPPEWKEVNDFFTSFGPKESDEYLWQMLTGSLTSIHDMSSAEERSALISFYEQAKELINHNYEMLQQVKEQYGIKTWPLK